MFKVNYYEMLGVNKNATPQEIKSTFYKKVREFPNETHPEQYQILRRAYETLIDEQKRIEYDKELNELRAKMSLSPLETEPPISDADPLIEERVYPEERSRDSRESHSQRNTNPRSIEDVNSRDIRKNSSRKRPFFINFAIILVICITSYFLFFNKENNIADSEQDGTNKSVVSTTGIENQKENQPVQNNNKSKNNVEGSETQSGDKNTPFPSDKEISTFMMQYFENSVDVVNGQNFSLVNSYLDPDGEKLQEQVNYTTYLQNKGISEKLISGTVTDTKVINDTYIEVTTEEVYEIFYSKEKILQKEFESKYRLSFSGGELLVNKLIFTNELNSKPISQTSKETIDKDEIATFLHNYILNSTEAVNQQNFSLVEHYLDPDGEKYAEQKKYTQYLIDKNISEELLNFQLIKVKVINDNSYEVTTREEYSIYYDDGTSKTKRFESKFEIITNENNYKVSKLVYTEELKS